MNRRNKIQAAIIALTMISGAVNSQESVSLKSVEGKLRNYCDAVRFEDVLIVTDRDCYVAGEPLWMKAFVTDRAAGTLSDRNSFVYAELVNPYHRHVAGIKIRIDAGSGSTVMNIPDTLSNGTYLLRAYTYSIREHFPEALFTRSITIVNPFNAKFINFNTTSESDQGKVSEMWFFPEGRTLLSGYNNKISIRAFDNYGNPASFSGIVMDSNGDSICEVNCDMTGITTMDLVPLTGLKYYLETSAGKKRFDLPAHSETGFSLRVTEKHDETVSVTIRRGPGETHGNMRGLFFLIRSGNRIMFSYANTAQDNEQKINIPVRNLAEGVNELVLLDDNGQVRSVRFFCKPAYINGPSAPDIKTAYSRREKIRIVLTGNDLAPAGESIKELTVSAVLDPLMTKGHAYRSASLLGNEYRIPEPSINRSLPFEALSDEKQDALLMSAKNTWIDWDKILQQEPTLLNDQFEKDGQLIFVSFLDGRGTVPDKDSPAFITSPGKAAELQYSLMDANSKFGFFITSAKSVKDLVIQQTDTLRNYSVKIEDQFLSEAMHGTRHPDTTACTVTGELARMSDNYQILKIYGNTGIGDLKNLPGINPDRVRFYGKPDQELKMSDYVSLPTMREVFFELIPGVVIRSDRYKKVQIMDLTTRRPLTLFIDGVLIDDPNQILNLDPEEVEQIDILTSDYRVGDLFIPGLINVITREADFSGRKTSRNAVLIPFRLYEPDRYFVSPAYDSPEAFSGREPDFRNTLYWDPSIKCDEDGRFIIEFWSSDNTGDYHIDLTGLSETGRIYHGGMRISVR